MSKYKIFGKYMIPIIPRKTRTAEDFTTNYIDRNELYEQVVHSGKDGLSTRITIKDLLLVNDDYNLEIDLLARGSNFDTTAVIAEDIIEQITDLERYLNKFSAKELYVYLGSPVYDHGEIFTKSLKVNNYRYDTEYHTVVDVGHYHMINNYPKYKDDNALRNSIDFNRLGKSLLQDRKVYLHEGVGILIPK